MPRFNKKNTDKHQQEKKDLLHSEWKKQLDSLNNDYKKFQHSPGCPCGCDDDRLPVIILSLRKKIDNFKKCPCGCIG
jgi:hypothetical protein